MKTLALVMTYLLAMLMGVYLTKQFIYHDTIEPHRWAITFVLFIMFRIHYNKEK